MTLKIITISFTSLIAIIAALYLWEGWSLPVVPGVFPRVAGVFTLILCLLLLVRDVRRLISGRTVDAETGTRMDIQSDHDMSVWATYKSALANFAWIPIIYIAILVLGFHIAMIVFFVMYLTARARVRWFPILGLVVLMAGFLLYFDTLLHAWWPEGLIERWVKLPWL